MVHRTERFIEIIDMAKKYNFEPKRVRFVYPNNKKISDLVLVMGKVEITAPVKVTCPLESDVCRELDTSVGHVTDVVIITAISQRSRNGEEEQHVGCLS